MTFSLVSNLDVLAGQRFSARSRDELSVAVNRLSSGLRINSARDDAAGMAIADRLQTQIRSTDRAARNLNDGISLAQVSESSLGSISNNLQRARQLAVESANATLSGVDRRALQAEVRQLLDEVDRIATQTRFNGQSLLDGSFSVQRLQAGGDAGQTITVPSIPSARIDALGVYHGFRYTYAGGPEGTVTPYTFGVSIGTGPVISLGSMPIDMKAQADAINAAGIPGLTGRAFDTFVAAGSSTAAATASGTARLTLNGTVISLSGTAGGAALASNRAAAVAAINAQSSLTGVVATDSGTGVSLAAPDGRNIVTAYAANAFTGSGMADFGLAPAGVRAGHQVVDYVAPIGVSGNISFFLNGSSAGNVFALGSMGSPVASVDISTVEGANEALASLDTALATVSAGRATLGAVQNRFFSAIARLDASSEQLVASRARIQDADLASEIANLTRAQVLQGAALAMLAQARQAPESVRELLR